MIHYTSPLRLQIAPHICKHDLKGTNEMTKRKNGRDLVHLLDTSRVGRRYSTAHYGYIGMRHGHVPEAEARSEQIEMCARDTYGRYTYSTKAVLWVSPDPYMHTA